MTTLTLDLPDTLAQRLREQQVTEAEIEAFALAALEIWLENIDRVTGTRSREGRFAGSAVPFVRSLIAQNRALFEILAKR